MESQLSQAGRMSAGVMSGQQMPSRPAADQVQSIGAQQATYGSLDPRGVGYVFNGSSDPRMFMQPAQGGTLGMAVGSPMTPGMMFAPMVGSPMVGGALPQRSWRERLTGMAREHYIITGLIIIAVIVLIWHLWSWHIRPAASVIVLERLYDWPGWVVEGTSPAIELVPLQITPNVLRYDIFAGGQKDHRASARVTHLPDGIMTCTGLHIRPLGSDLELAINSSTQFYPLRRSKVPSLVGFGENASRDDLRGMLVGGQSV